MKRLPIVAVKLGGSLLTDKTKRDHARDEVIERLAGEVAEALPALARRGECLLIGHGSGSFGHVAAHDHGLAAGRSGGEPLAASVVQDAAARLHRVVVGALVAAGVPAWSCPPSAQVVARGAEPAHAGLRSLFTALDAGLVPVVHGDVLLDLDGGATIASTEAVFDALVPRLRRRGHAVDRLVWLGATAGILDAAGETVPWVDSDNARRVRRLVGGAAGTDVTGGMLLRLDTARRLARRGIASLVADGRVPSLLADALAGGDAAPPGDPFGDVDGTRVLP